MRSASLVAAALACACTQQAPTPTPASIPEPQAASKAVPATPATTAKRADAAQAFSLPGRFTPADTQATLEARYGAANVQAGEVPGAEGERVEGITLFADDPTRRAYLYFDDAAAARGLSTVRVLDMPSRWQLDDGIAIGMPLAALVQRNGKPVRFYGLDWDYGGAVSGWNGGRLEPLAAPAIHRSIGLATRAEIGDAPYPMGDGTFSSDDPAFPNVGRDLVVGELGITFRNDTP